MASEARVLDESRTSGVRLRETRMATVDVRVGSKVWRAVLDGPKLGPCVVIYWMADTGWRLWGTAVWLDDLLQHATARIVDIDVTAALERALRTELAR